MDRRLSPRALNAAEKHIAVSHILSKLARGVFDPDLLDRGVQFISDKGCKTGVDTLPHLQMLADKIAAWPVGGIGLQ